MWVKPVFNWWDKCGTLISKFEEKSWDIDIKKITVSHCDHIACSPILIPSLMTLEGGCRTDEKNSTTFGTKSPKKLNTRSEKL